MIEPSVEGTFTMDKGMFIAPNPESSIKLIQSSKQGSTQNSPDTKDNSVMLTGRRKKKSEKMKYLCT